MDRSKQSKICDAKRLLKEAFKMDPARFTMWRVARYYNDLRTLNLDEPRLNAMELGTMTLDIPRPILVRHRALDRSQMILLKKMLKSKL
jgi:hypothetical protein